MRASDKARIWKKRSFEKKKNSSFFFLKKHSKKKNKNLNTARKNAQQEKHAQQNKHPEKDNSEKDKSELDTSENHQSEKNTNHKKTTRKNTQWASLFEKEVFCNHRKPRNEWRAHCKNVVLDTQRFSIPNTTVAILKATTLHQQCSRMSVRETQSWDLTAERKMRMPQSWLTSVFAERTRNARKWQMRFVRCGPSHSPLGCPLIVDHRNHSNWKKSWNWSFCPLSRLIPPRTRPRTIPLKRRRRRWVCLLLLLHGASPSIFLFLLAFSDNLCCQMILGVLHYQQIDVRALLNVQPSPMYPFT